MKNLRDFAMTGLIFLECSQIVFAENGIKNEKCRDVVFVERGAGLSDYLQNRDFSESDLINYILEINNLKNSDPTPYGRHLFFPVYSEKRCKEIEAKKSKTYADTLGRK